MDENGTGKNGDERAGTHGPGNGRGPFPQRRGDGPANGRIPLPLQVDTGPGHGRTPPFQFLSRLIPLAVIAVMLMLLLPHLRRDAPLEGGIAYVEPPLGLEGYNTASDTLNTLLHEGLKRFGRRDYDEAARLLSKAYFYSSVKVRLQEFSTLPNDLRFYLGLAYFYRNQAAKGIPLLEDEARDSPGDEKYHWYLAHLYLAAGEYERAAQRLRTVVTLGGTYASAAREKLNELEATGAGR